MLVEKAFKVFTESTLKEPINKNKKNYDYCIDTYAKTQLIDIVSLYSGPDIFSDIPPDSPFIERYNVNQPLPSECAEINLPFDSCFFKLYDTQHESVGAAYLFIREYAPMVYTGALLLELIPGKVLKIVFKISDCELEYNIRDIVIKTLKLPSFLKTCSGVIIRALKIINKLSPKVHNIYKVAPEHTEYLRKKLTRETIKVRRPIYIYINQKEKENTINPTKQYNAERVTRELSWIVRGHWRRLDSPSKRGKNANGEYVVEGYTWVVPHVCGNKDILPERRLYITTGD